MNKGNPKMQSILLLIVLIALVISGCGTKGYQPPAPVTAYTVSGIVVDEDDAPLKDVEIKFSEPFESVYTSEEGTWTKSGLYESVTVTPMKVGYVFDPVNMVVTKANSNVNFKGTAVPTYNVSGNIAKGNVGPAGGLEGVTLSYEYPAGTAQTVTTDANGDWTIPNISGTVTVTPSKAGWEFSPESFTVTETDFTGKNAVANRVSYSGSDVMGMANGNLNLAAGAQIPTTITLDGDMIRIEEALYLVAKFTAIADTEVLDTKASGVPTAVSVVIPDKVPFLTIGKPTTTPSGDALTGYMMYQSYKTLAEELVAALEADPVLPNGFDVTYSTATDPDTGDSGRMKIDMIISILGRVVAWPATYDLTGSGYPGVPAIPNYASIRTTGTPSDWP